MGCGRRESRAWGGHFLKGGIGCAMPPTAPATGADGEPLPMARLWILGIFFGGMPERMRRTFRAHFEFCVDIDITERTRVRMARLTRALALVGEANEPVSSPIARPLIGRCGRPAERVAGNTVPAREKPLPKKEIRKCFTAICRARFLLS